MIDRKYKDFAVTESALKNLIKYSYLRYNYIKAGNTRAN